MKPKYKYHVFLMRRRVNRWEAQSGVEVLNGKEMIKLQFVRLGILGRFRWQRGLSKGLSHKNPKTQSLRTEMNLELGLKSDM